MRAFALVSIPLILLILLPGPSVLFVIGRAITLTRWRVLNAGDSATRRVIRPPDSAWRRISCHTRASAAVTPMLGTLLGDELHAPYSLRPCRRPTAPESIP
ncbi:hypothetical protein BHD05_07455 [Marisediminicola antarctica]|uniref:Uncharacterized protein n=2 Tax=Marisediminicola antarctica TaxID=674079 RepID=A0A7L5AG62_9MICO|nr:hypothetical protein BHD05_07455 [Marisediminicola antarctica]